MEEIEYEVTRNSSVDEDELDRYAVYRLLLLSFEKDVRSGDMEFDELIDIEKVAADICRYRVTHYLSLVFAQCFIVSEGVRFAY